MKKLISDKKNKIDSIKKHITYSAYNGYVTASVELNRHNSRFTRSRVESRMGADIKSATNNLINAVLKDL